MIVYLEGVDGSGKSVLDDQICTALAKTGMKVTIVGNAEEYIPTRPVPADKRIDERTLMRLLSDWADEPTSVYILDRGPISDIIYRAFDEYEPVVSLKRIITNARNHSDGWFVVHCHNDLAYKQMCERGDDNPVAIEHHQQIAKLYEQIMPLFELADCQYASYDWTQTTRQNVVQRIVAWVIQKLNDARCRDCSADFMDYAEAADKGVQMVFATDGSGDVSFVGIGEKYGKD